MHMQTLSQLCMAEGSHGHRGGSHDGSMMGRDAAIKHTSWAHLVFRPFPLLREVSNALQDECSSAIDCLCGSAGCPGKWIDTGT